MRYSSKASVEYDLELHYKLRDSYIEKCKALGEHEGACLKQSSVKHGKIYYSLKRPGQSRYGYVGDDSHVEIREIKEFRFYKKALSVIETNILAMEEFLKIYRRTDTVYINELLSSTYGLPHRDAVLLLEPEIDEWMRKNLAIKEKAPVFDPASLTVKAFDGKMMRSRAECIHHEAFFIYNVPSIFELPYKISGDWLHPDFTALDVFTMSPVIFEHLGSWFHSNAVKRSRSRNDAVSRWDQFAKIGFTPEKNLLLTFGSDENNFDIQSIHRKIAMLASPPPSEETINMLRRF
jgi:hypothetical protein